MKKLFTYIHNRHQLAWYLAVFWTIGIFIGCSRPGKDLPKLNLFDNFDKVVHFIFFFGFAFLWQAVFSKYNKSVWVSIVVAFIYGTAIEIYQKYCVLGRSFDVWDIVADGVGAMAILIVVKKAEK